MLQTSSIISSKSYSDKYFLSFILTDELFSSLKYENSPNFVFAIKDTISSVTYANRTYNASFNRQKCNHEIVSYKNPYEIVCENQGSVTVKGSSSVCDRNGSMEMGYTSSNSHGNNNRKRYSSQVLDTDQPTKKLALDKNTKNYSSNDLLSTGQSNTLETNLHKTKSKQWALDLLKSGRTVKDVSQLCNISESTVKEYISTKTDLRQEISKESLKKVESSNRQSLTKSISNKNVISNTSSNSENKIEMSVDFDISTLNEKIQFGNRTIVNNKAGKITIPDDYGLELKSIDHNNNNYLFKSNTTRDQNKIKPPMRTNHINKDNIPSADRIIKNSPFVAKDKQDNRKSVSKDSSESRNTEMRKSAVKERSERDRRDYHEPNRDYRDNIKLSAKDDHHSRMKDGPQRDISFVTKKHEENKSSKHSDSFMEPIRKPDNSRSILNSNKRDRDTENRQQLTDDSRNKSSSHYPTEPYQKNQDETLITTKALTEPKTVPKKDFSNNFEYSVINPTTISFKPNPSPHRDLINSDPDTDEFRKDVLDTFYRLETCETLYSKYGIKRDELRDRALASRTNEQLQVLYEEYYHLQDEQKQPFFVMLENEIDVLQAKLFEMSSLMGVTISQSQ